LDKIVCIGKNYGDHVKEMAAMLGDRPADKPVLFLKPPSVLRTAKAGETLSLALPSGTVHHECEIVLRLASGGSHLSMAQAEKAIEAVTLGLDMTRRDLQAELKAKGHPWTTAKVFVDSAIVGPWRSVAEFPRYLEEPFRFHLNGELKQEGWGRDMLTQPAAALVHASEHFPLCAGDLIFTGCPAGVGPVTIGQVGRLSWAGMEYQVRWDS